MENIVVSNVLNGDILGEQGFLDIGRNKTFVIKLSVLGISNLNLSERDARTQINSVVRPLIEVGFTVEGWRFANKLNGSGVPEALVVGRDSEPTFLLS